MILLLLAILSAPPGTLDANIRGTAEPLEVQLVHIDDAGQWHEVRQLRLPAESRRVHFGDLTPGVYQIILRGSDPTEQLATRIHLRSGDRREMTITVEPLTLAGHVTHGGTDLGSGTILLHQNEHPWRAPIALASDGTFLVQLWQRGTFQVTVRAPSLSTPFTDTIELNGSAPLRMAIDIPQGRVQSAVAMKLARR